MHEPLSSVEPMPGSRGVIRYAAMLLGLGCAMVLGVAIWLTPDPSGVGTHQQLGAGRCSLLTQTGLPCPTCGMTTAFAYTVRGHVFSAMWAQPAGFVLALATIVALGLSVRGVVTGSWPPIERYIPQYWLFLGLLVLLLVGWAYKIVQVITSRPGA